jgi:hypothetical protein
MAKKKVKKLVADNIMAAYPTDEQRDEILAAMQLSGETKKSRFLIRGALLLARVLRKQQGNEDTSAEKLLETTRP